VGRRRRRRRSSRRLPTDGSQMVDRYNCEGLAGLIDRSSRLHRPTPQGLSSKRRFCAAAPAADCRGSAHLTRDRQPPPQVLSLNRTGLNRMSAGGVPVTLKRKRALSLLQLAALSAETGATFPENAQTSWTGGVLSAQSYRRQSPGERRPSIQSTSRFTGS